MKGLQSPWGVRASICAHFHWTYNYLLWGISWVNVQMFLSDLPTYDDGKKKEDTYNEITNEDEMKSYLNSLM